MKKILLSLAILIGLCGAASAQCNGLFPPSTVCGNSTASPAPPKAIPSSGGLITTTCILIPTVCTAIFGYADPVWYGADPTGAADSASAFNSALSDSSNVIFSHPGKYKFLSAITYNIATGVHSLSIACSGADNTILFWPTGNGITVNYVFHGNSFHMRDCTVSTGAANSGNGVTLTQTDCLADFAQSDFYRVTFRGDDAYAAITDYWSNAINIVGVSGINYDGLTLYGGFGSGSAQGNGINIAGNPVDCGTTTGYSIYHNISKNTLNNLNNGIVLGGYTQGLTLTQSNLQGSNFGILVPGSSPGNLLEMLVSNNQFATVKDSILIGTSYNLSTFTGNLIAPGANFAAIDIQDTNQAFTTITGNVIVCDSLTATHGIALQGDGTNIISNQIQFCGIGLAMLGSAFNTLVQGNFFGGNTTAITDVGSNNTIKDNGGYNPVGSSMLTVGASPFTYTAGDSPETVYIFGGAVSDVSVSGFFNCTGTQNCTINLDPHASVVVNYTMLPDIVKTVH
jgi:hypothetical protein